MIDLKNLIEIVYDSKHTLFILCGFPYAGKSFVAQQLLQKTDAAFVNIDEILLKYGFDWDSNNVPNVNEWEQIFNESYVQAKKALMEGRNVLYDSTNHTVASRETLRGLAQSVDAATYVLYVKTPIETVWKRWEDNQKNQSRSVVHKDLVQMTIDMFEEPAENENVIVINN